MIAAWMLFSLFPVGLLGRLLLWWSSAVCRRGDLDLQCLKLLKAHFLLFFREITFMNSRRWSHPERENTSLTFQALEILSS